MEEIQPKSLIKSQSRNGSKLIMPRYGLPPTVIDEVKVECQEMMFYQYMPIKMAGISTLTIGDYERRLWCFHELITLSTADFIQKFGRKKFNESYVYITAKRMYQDYLQSFNRSGWHSDGFMTDDINYIWSDRNPTIFNIGHFNLTMDDQISMKQMEDQAKEKNNLIYPDNTLLRLNQYQIHRVGNKIGDKMEVGMRTFFKLSFSNDKYDLEGNTHNEKLNYSWEMKKRKEARNIPQSIIGTKNEE